MIFQSVEHPLKVFKLREEEWWRSWLGRLSANGAYSGVRSSFQGHNIRRKVVRAERGDAKHTLLPVNQRRPVLEKGTGQEAMDRGARTRKKGHNSANLEKVAS